VCTAGLGFQPRRASEVGPLGRGRLWRLPGVLPERAMPPLRRAGAAVAPSFAWDRVRSGGSSEEKGTRLAYEARNGS